MSEEADFTWVDNELCEICGSTVFWEECWNCGGEGYRDLYDEDPLWYDYDDIETCEICRGRGGHWICGNAEDHERILAERAGRIAFLAWQIKDRWRANKMKGIHGKLRTWYYRKTWPIRNGRVMAKIRWFFFPVTYYGWHAFLPPVERCTECGKVWRVLFWVRGEHTNCVPF